MVRRSPWLLPKVIQESAEALHSLHKEGWIHCDVKPSNVLMDQGRWALLTDFGLARSMASRVSIEGTVAGTVFYLAPELALGQEYDGRADLYALGVMLYELTTGRLPFTADDPIAVISQHVHAPAIPPRARDEEIPPALSALIIRLLAKDPQDRPASAAEVLRTLDDGFADGVGGIPGKLAQGDNRIPVRGHMLDDQPLWDHLNDVGKDLCGWSISTSATPRCG